MPLLYNPIDGSEMDGLIKPFPRAAFLMIHDNDRVSTIESQMQTIVREELAASNYLAKTAAGARNTGDFLSKIIQLIRGCGFGIAIFSDVTPPKTLANIFFEVGYCLALGKPTYLILAGEGAAPSDFVRSEWIEFKSDRADEFRQSVRDALTGMDEYGQFLENLAATAEDAEEVDPELAFERFKRAYLVSGAQSALDGIGRIHGKVRNAQSDAEISSIMKSYRRKISDEIGHFKRVCRP